MLNKKSVLITLATAMILNPVMANLALAEQSSSLMPPQTQNSNSLSIEQKIQLINQTRAYIDQYNFSLSKVNAKIVNNDMYYNIGNIGSSLTGWLLAIEVVQAYRGKISAGNQNMALKFAAGLLLSFGALEVMERTTRSSLMVSSEEKEKIQKQLSELSSKLEKLENNLFEIDQM